MCARAFKYGRFKFVKGKKKKGRFPEWFEFLWATDLLPVMSEGHMLPTHNEPRIQTHSHTHKVAAWLHCRRSCQEEVLLMLTIVSSSAGMTGVGGRQLLLLGLQSGGVEEGLGGWRMSRQVKSQTDSMNINRRLNSVSFRRCFKPNVGQWRKSPQIYHFLSRVVYFLKSITNITVYTVACICYCFNYTMFSPSAHLLSLTVGTTITLTPRLFCWREEREKKGSPLNDQLPLPKEKIGFSSGCSLKEIGIFWFEVASSLPAYENGNTVYSLGLPHMHTWAIMDSEQIIQNNRPLFWVVLCFTKVHQSFFGF